MKYYHCITDIDYLEPDGYGPLSYETASGFSEWEDNFTTKNSLHSNVICPHISLNLSKGMSPQTVILPQKSKMILVSQDASRIGKLRTSMESVVECSLDFNIESRQKEQDYIVGLFKFRSMTADTWIDFAASTFSLVKATSIGSGSFPKVLESGIQFMSARELSKGLDGLSPLRRIVPEKLQIKASSNVHFFQIGNMAFFSQKGLTGIMESGLHCSIVED